MLVIRTEQFKLFEGESRARFVREMVDHARRYLPYHFHALGEQGTREAIQYGIDRARAHEIVSVPGVRAYVQLMFVLGPDFDQDPQMPWAPEALSADDEKTRIQKLLAGAQQHLDRKAKALEGK
jgi:hypothetical protein